MVARGRPRAGRKFRRDLGVKEGSAVKLLKKLTAFLVTTAWLCALPAAGEPLTEKTTQGAVRLPEEAPLFMGAQHEGPRVSLGRRNWMTFGAREFGPSDDWDFRTYRAGMGWDVGDGASVSGTYMVQDIAPWNRRSQAFTDNPEAWTVALRLSRQKLRFTDLWVEYARMDAGFYLPGGEGFSESFARPFSRGGTAWFMEDTDVLYLTARQQWGENFSTFQSYARYESGPSQYSRSWAVGLGYRYRPGLYMEVSLSDQDGALDNPDYADRKVRVRTMISF